MTEAEARKVRRRTVVIVAILVIGLGAGVWTAISDALDRPHCVDVKNPTLLDSLNVPAASAWRASGDAYYVADQDGAIWLARRVSMTADDGGLVLPLNDKARISTPTDASPTAPVFEGRGPEDSGAVHAYDCAAR